MADLFDLPVEEYLKAMRENKRKSLSTLGVNIADGSVQFIEALWLRNYYMYHIEKKRHSTIPLEQIEFVPVYYLLQITYGEYEFFVKGVEKCKMDDAALPYIRENIARNFYGEADHIEQDYGEEPTFFFDSGMVAVKVFSVQEISWDEYETLKKYL